MSSGADDIAAVAIALDVDPESVRGDTPLASLGWSGTAAEWAVVSDHLGYPLAEDPAPGAVPATIAELVAIVHTAMVSARSQAERKG